MIYIGNFIYLDYFNVLYARVKKENKMVNFTGLIKVSQGCYRNTDVIKGFGGADDGKTRIHYIDGSNQVMDSSLKNLVTAFELSKITGKTIDATSDKALADSTEKAMRLSLWG